MSALEQIEVEWTREGLVNLNVTNSHISHDEAFSVTLEDQFQPDDEIDYEFDQISCEFRAGSIKLYQPGMSQD